MFEAHISIDLTLLFSKGKCPLCGRVLKKRFMKKHFSEEERKSREYRAQNHGRFGGPMKGYNSNLYLVCGNCGIFLNSDQYKLIKKKQKEKKSTILNEEEFEQIMKKHQD